MDLHHLCWDKNKLKPFNDPLIRSDLSQEVEFTDLKTNWRFVQFQFESETKQQLQY